MNQPILHPTDFSKCSKVALDYAVMLAKMYQCELILVHSINWSKLEDYNQVGWSMLSKSSEIEKATEEELARMGNKIIEQGVQCKAELYNGSLTSWFPKKIREIKPRMVVMGTTGAGSFSNKMFGSNTNAIMKASKSPVLAVPQDSTHPSPKNIMLVTDLKHANIDAIKYMSEFTDTLKGKLEVVHAHKAGEESASEDAVNKIKETLNEMDTHQKVEYKMIVHNNYLAGISQYIANNEPDLFAIVKTSKNFFTKFLYGSLSEKLIYNANVPVLVIPQEIE